MLAGCPVGGTIALDAALAAADRVAGLALVSPRPGLTWPEDMTDPLLDRIAATVFLDALPDRAAGGASSCSQVRAKAGDLIPQETSA